jgi:4-amino-4-deoxy-L-arabinose transferase-like glycosyltransferase
MNQSVALERLVIGVVPLLTVWGIWSYGLWDPWELGVADDSRAGRLPGVLAGWLTCLLAFLLLRRHFSRRAGVIAIAVIASTPLFLLNARLLMGNSVAVFA